MGNYFSIFSVDHGEVSDLETGDDGGTNLMNMPDEIIFEILPKLDLQDFHSNALAELYAKKLDRDLQFYYYHSMEVIT